MEPVAQGHPGPAQTSWDLHFTQVPGGLLCMFKCERHPLEHLALPSGQRPSWRECERQLDVPGELLKDQGGNGSVMWLHFPFVLFEVGNTLLGR